MFRCKQIPDDFEVLGTLPNIYCQMVFTDKGLNDLTPVLVDERLFQKMMKLFLFFILEDDDSHEN